MIKIIMTITGFKGSKLDVIVFSISNCKIKVTRLVSGSIALYYTTSPLLQCQQIVATHTVTKM